jgi:response regulator RpfG family c-di-GMP phosphodiesterase
VIGILMTLISKKSALIIDDNLKTREMVKDSLVEDFHIHAAETPEEVLRFLKKKSIDLILINYEMADMKKDEFVKIIEEHYCHREVWAMSIFSKVADFYKVIATFFIEKTFKKLSNFSLKTNRDKEINELYRKRWKYAREQDDYKIDLINGENKRSF